SGSLATFAAITPEQIRQLPAPPSRQIDFSKEIKPILETSCTKCHGRGKEKGGFKMDNRETFMKGGDSGPAVIIGKSEQSLLIELVMGFDPENVMPQKGSKLKPEQIGLLRAWIDQGVKWDDAVWLGKVDAKNLKPNLPSLAKSSLANPVDAIVDRYFKTNKTTWPELISDSVFARRVYLDVHGLLPPTDELAAFLADKNSRKREQLVQRLLSEQSSYAEHWLTFWNDLLRNDYKGTGYIDGGRKQITKWLYSALATNMPYDQFVAQLVNPTPDSEGFSKGIIWRGTVNASQVPQMQAAQSISQVFMGINMKCASCHDSFVNDWQLSDAYALANIFADEPLEIFQCDKPTGKKAGTKFLYPEFGKIDPAADKPTRLKQLADCMTSPQNGRFSRTLVNRFWGKLMGRALVEPVDDMDQTAWNSNLLDWLAEDFAAHQYDVKHLIAQIITSRTYQLPAVNVDEAAREYVFRGPSVRRLSAEQFRDALTALTGIGYAKADAVVGEVVTNKNKTYPIIYPNWIWSSKDAENTGKAGTVYFRKTIQVTGEIRQAVNVLTCDNGFSLFVNGKKVASGNDWTHPELFDLKPFLKQGENVIAIEGINNLPGNLPPTADNTIAGTENPAGLLFYLQLRTRESGSEKITEIVSDNSWRASEQKLEGWEKSAFAAEKWMAAVDLGQISMLPWRVEKKLISNRLIEGKPGKIRAALVAADPLMVSLGRPNREQVVTTRPTSATTLQALEITNGETLSDILKRGAANLSEEAKTNRELIDRIFRQALGRKPTGN
ncbi:MAG: DUF1549 domain-containing protein, partial [Verrucomicrobiota bacterium]